MSTSLAVSSTAPGASALADGSVLHIYDSTGDTCSNPQSVGLSANVEVVAWSPTKEYCVSGDAAGALNFVLRDGRLLLRHQLIKSPGAVPFAILRPSRLLNTN